jgi:predicted GNAT family acetyltransferase
MALLNRGKVPLLSVDQRNIAAVRLYDKIGYVPIYEAAHYCIPKLVKSVDGN